MEHGSRPKDTEDPEGGRGGVRVGCDQGRRGPPPVFTSLLIPPSSSPVSSDPPTLPTMTTGDSFPPSYGSNQSDRTS